MPRCWPRAGAELDGADLSALAAGSRWPGRPEAGRRDRDARAMGTFLEADPAPLVAAFRLEASAAWRAALLAPFEFATTDVDRIDELVLDEARLAATAGDRECRRAVERLAAFRPPPTGHGCQRAACGGAVLSNLRAERGLARQRDLEPGSASTSTGDAFAPSRRRRGAARRPYRRRRPCGSRLSARHPATRRSLRRVARPRDREAGRPGGASRARARRHGRLRARLLARTAGRVACARRYRCLCSLAGFRGRHAIGAGDLAGAGLAQCRHWPSEVDSAGGTSPNTIEYDRCGEAAG